MLVIFRQFSLIIITLVRRLSWSCAAASPVYPGHTSAPGPGGAAVLTPDPGGVPGFLHARH